MGSIEGCYRRLTNGPASTAPLGADPVLAQVDVALLRMPRELLWLRRGKVIEIPGLTLRLVYERRWSPATVCQALAPRLRPQAWAGHIGVMRSLLAAQLAKRES